GQANGDIDRGEGPHDPRRRTDPQGPEDQRSGADDTITLTLTLAWPSGFERSSAGWDKSNHRGGNGLQVGRATENTEGTERYPLIYQQHSAFTTDPSATKYPMIGETP